MDTKTYMRHWDAMATILDAVTDISQAGTLNYLQKLHEEAALRKGLVTSVDTTPPPMG